LAFLKAGGIFGCRLFFVRWQGDLRSIAQNFASYEKHISINDLPLTLCI